MGRGGTRKGAGRKTTWASGRTYRDTTVIRVPKEYADVLLSLAHRLDAGEDIDFVTKTNNESKLDKIELVTNSANMSQLELFAPDFGSSVESELVTESNEGRNPPVFYPFSSKLLALRLGIGNTILSKAKSQKSRREFYHWIQEKDPDGIFWESVGSLKGYSKGYLPAKDTPVSSLINLQHWLDNNQ